MTSPGSAVFTYGTLMFAEVVEALLGRTFAQRTARLRGYARFGVRGRVYPGIVAREGAAVEGVLWEGLDGDALARLDEFEGDLYARRRVAVDLVAGASDAPGGTAGAFVYVVAPGREGELDEAPWDPQAFLVRNGARYVAHCRALRRARGDASTFEP